MNCLAEATCAIALSGQSSWAVATVVAVILSEAPHGVSLVLSESAHIGAVILSEASHAVSLVLPEPTVSSESPHV